MSDDELLAEVLTRFEYRDGALFYRRVIGSMKIGRKAGSVNSRNYYHVEIKSKNFLVHRLIFLMHKGFLPEFIDHIDGNKQNNCIENLREASNADNCSNARIRKDNTSGFKGVSWHNKQKKWVAYANKNLTRKYLGLFASLEDAASAVMRARSELHGEFARHN